MTSDRTDHDQNATDPLESFFAAARAEAPELGTELRARIVASSVPVPLARPAPPRRFRGLISGWAASLLAGAVTAALGGLWVGVMMPLPVLALDVPLWLDDAFAYVDAVALPLLGLDDPFILGF